ncbi:pyridoxamine 5'-phosphate oxidase family protein [Lichenihabitans sp. Uapishka_5]|uniref:pyridoxamine 5'-phosphate oxidase family protein n=1 Tax=Lichenihabitans sp. Uapishka_5 TaxID=3037302 RepID=UPI0029E8257A|nr:pyridoxamine 5'-phosphate oxidase family protein [Lichenihabitans sp. Uapishka_5]MDX7953564.1 pyridoxamine 5'-phosphate oxidase family protein [Lichenihabitans sp. Uapishka_5]
MTDDVVHDLSALRALYSAVGEASRVKEVDYLHPVYAAFIKAAPFLVLATSGPVGLDASPRGDAEWLVTILDQHTLLLPDRRGNNRIDSLENILADPRVGLLFLIPGVGETLRVNGSAEILATPALLDRFAVEGKRPRTVLRITVESVFFQCSRAVVRAGLWDPSRFADRASLPSAGDILAALSREAIDGADYDRALPERLRTTLY